MDYTMGQIVAFAFNFAPMGFMKCDGTILQNSQNQALFSLLGYQYGGDGRTTFAIPNLVAAAPAPNLYYYICVQGLYPQRQ